MSPIFAQWLPKLPKDLPPGSAAFDAHRLRPDGVRRRNNAPHRAFILKSRRTAISPRQCKLSSNKPSRPPVASDVAARDSGKLPIYRLLDYVTGRVTAAVHQIGRPQNPTFRGTMDGSATWPILRTKGAATSRPSRIERRRKSQATSAPWRLSGFRLVADVDAHSWSRSSTFLSDRRYSTYIITTSRSPPAMSRASEAIGGSLRRGMPLPYSPRL